MFYASNYRIAKLKIEIMFVPNLNIKKQFTLQIQLQNNSEQLNQLSMNKSSENKKQKQKSKKLFQLNSSEQWKNFTKKLVKQIIKWLLNYQLINQWTDNLAIVCFDIKSNGLQVEYEIELK